MKTVIAFFAAVMMTFTTLSANTHPAAEGPLPNAQAEQPAVFMGDNDMIQPWLIGEVTYPTLALENSREGRVVIKFTVDENGRPKDFVAMQGIGLGCEEAVIQAIQRMPRWTPARVGGEKVAVSMTVSVDFSMR